MQHMDITVPRPIPRYGNFGSPMTRCRSEPLSATVLGNRKGDIYCPRVIRVCIDFMGHDPLEAIYRLLGEQGYEDPQQLKGLRGIPKEPAICRITSIPKRRKVTAPAHLVLRDAALLGMCTAWHFDPARPVLWTRASLTRSLELYDGEGFYA